MIWSALTAEDFEKENPDDYKYWVWKERSMEEKSCFKSKVTSNYVLL